MPSKRLKQVSGLLKSEISHIMQTRMKDPLVGFTTITDVVVSNDLRIAKVYISVYGDDQKKQDTLRGLERARAFIQAELSTRVRLRYLPVLHFYMDESVTYGMHIDHLLDGIRDAESEPTSE